MMIEPASGPFPSVPYLSVAILIVVICLLSAALLTRQRRRKEEEFFRMDLA